MRRTSHVAVGPSTFSQNISTYWLRGSYPIGSTTSSYQGTITIDGADVTAGDARIMRAAGLAYVPEEPLRDGAIGAFSLAANLLGPDHGDPRYARRGFLRFGCHRRPSDELVHAFAHRLRPAASAWPRQAALRCHARV